MIDSYSGAQKAAILLLQLGHDRASTILSTMRPEDVERIAPEIASLNAVSRDEVDAVFTEFEQLATTRMSIVQGGLGPARELLEATVGPERAAELLSRLSTVINETPFAFLAKAEPKQVLNALRNEDAQTIAVVISHMHRIQATEVFSALPEEVRPDVAWRLVNLERVDPKVLARIEGVFERRLSGALDYTPVSAAAIGGVPALAEILNETPKAVESEVLEAIRERNPVIADQIAASLFTFDDLLALQVRTLADVLAKMAGAEKTIALAVKGLTTEARDLLMSAMAEGRRRIIEEEGAALGAQTQAAVDEARSEIIRTARQMEEAGEIVLVSAGSGELLE